MPKLVATIGVFAQELVVNVSDDDDDDDDNDDTFFWFFGNLD